MTLTAQLTAHIDAAIATGHEEGVQLCIYHAGTMIVDITRGTKNNTSTALAPDDLVLVWSTSKGITATAMHILAERNAINYDDAIAYYWPAFAQHGKSAVSIRHLMSHTAGFPQLPDNISLDTQADFAAMCDIVAGLTLQSRPGQVAAYHGLTYGWPLAKIIEIVDGRPFAQFVQDEICKPLDIHDLFFGVPAHRTQHRTLLSHDLGDDVIAIHGSDPTPFANHDGIQRGVYPAANMMANARAIAKVYASLVGQGVGGKRLLSPRRIDIATKVQRWAMDQTLNSERGFGLGYFLGEIIAQFPQRDDVFGHEGYGGAVGFADPRYNIAFGLTKTRMTLRPKATMLTAELMRIVQAHFNMSA